MIKEQYKIKKISLCPQRGHAAERYLPQWWVLVGRRMLPGLHRPC